MLKRALLFTLAKLSNPTLAESMLGDLEATSHPAQTDLRPASDQGQTGLRPRSDPTLTPHRRRLWFWRAALGLVLYFAWRRLLDAAIAAPSVLRASGVAAEARQALRGLVRTPVVTAVIVLTLALGFGLNTAIFSVVHSVLFEPLPFDRPEEIVIVQGSRRGEAPSVFGTSYPDYRDFAADQKSFRSLASCTYWTFTLTGTDVPQRLLGQRVSGSFFPTLGMQPAIGRWIDIADDVRGGPEVVVISHGLWQRAFGGDPAVTTRELDLNGLRAKVVGVMPAQFRFPFDDVELWAPARDELDTIPRNSRFLTTLGRLKAGMRAVDAEAELVRLAAGLEAQYPQANRDWRPSLRAAVPALTTAVRPRLMLLLGAVIVVLLVACVNVTTLVLARSSSRRHEFALRRALGATGARIVRVTGIESAWLGLAGLAAGLLVAAPAVTALRALAPVGLPRLSNVGLHWSAFWWAAAAMLAFVAMSAVAPAVSLRVARAEWMRSRTTTGPGRAWGRRLLIALQVAGAFALLVGAGLLVRSFSRVLAVDPGFDPTNVATVRVFLTPPAYRTLDSQIDYVARAVDTLAHVPGVRSAAAVSQPPFDVEGSGTTLGAAVEGRVYAAGTHPLVAYRATSVSYFETIGLRLLEGRLLTADDRRGAPLVAVINHAMATRFWPGESPLGRRFEFADGRNAGALTVIGVVNDVATDGLEEAEAPVVYAPFVQRTLPFLRWMTLVVRTDTDVSAAMPVIRARLQAVDPRQPLYGISTMAAALATSMAERRFALVLMMLFAALALTLAALGLYGTLAQRVADRSRELGVRLALGARPGQVFGLVMREGATLVGTGVGLGVLVVWLGVPLIRDSLFGVAPTDFRTYCVIASVLACTTAIATIWPSRTASRTDPIAVLKD